MHITNIYDFPPQVYDAVVKSRYSGESAKHDFSVTDLLRPPHMRALRKKHWHDLRVDVSEKVAAFRGRAIHEAIRQTTEVDAVSLPEERLYATLNGVTISGESDVYYHDRSTDQMVIADYKSSKTYAYTNEDHRHEYDAQLNLYAWLWRQHGYKVDRIEIVFIFDGWIRANAGKGDYPDAPVKRLQFDLWTDEVCEGFIDYRVAYHRQAAAGEITGCTPEERWEKPTKYRVWKHGGKAPSKTFDTYGKCVDWLQGRNHAEYRIDHIPGERVRCTYCESRSACGNYIEHLREYNIGDELIGLPAASGVSQ